MNKFQKMALQCIKDDYNMKVYNDSIKKGKRIYETLFKKNKWSFEKVKVFRECNKEINNEILKHQKKEINKWKS